MDMDTQKTRASAWFEDLRDQICSSFEALEDALESGPQAGLAPGRFLRKPTRRQGEAGEDAGGGVMSVMKGRVFEKVGVNISTVHGTLSAAARASMRARKDMGGIDDDPRFWAAGISDIPYPRAMSGFKTSYAVCASASLILAGLGTLK
mgnify:CR=1 FL=1